MNYYLIKFPLRVVTKKLFPLCFLHDFFEWNWGRVTCCLVIYTALYCLSYVCGIFLKHIILTIKKIIPRTSQCDGQCGCLCVDVAAADTTDVTDDADSDLDMADDLLDQSDDEDRKRDLSTSASGDDKVDAIL